MDIFSVLNLLGGLALFLYGMSTLGDGLSKMAGGKMESILQRLTSKRLAVQVLPVLYSPHQPQRLWL